MKITRTSPISNKTRTLELPLPDTYGTTDATHDQQLLADLTTEQRMFLLEGNLWEDLESEGDNTREGEDRYHK